MSGESFSYQTCPGQHDGVVVCTITGPLTLNHMFGFQGPFREMKPPVLILDLSECNYMDSAGLGLVMNQFVSAESGKRKFVLAGVGVRIRALMDVTRVSSILKSYPTVAEAEAAAQGHIP